MLVTVFALRGSFSGMGASRHYWYIVITLPPRHMRARTHTHTHTHKGKRRLKLWRTNFQIAKRGKRLNKFLIRSV